MGGFRGGQEAERETVSPGLFDGDNHVRVEVNGDACTLYIEGLLRSEYAYSRRSEGMPGLAGCGSFYDVPTFDNFRVTELD